MELEDFKKFQSIVDKYTNATVKKGGPLGNMTLKKWGGGNWVKGNDKKGSHSGLEKSKKKGVIEFKIGQQSKKGGHRGNGSLKMGAYWQAHAAGSSWECPPPRGLVCRFLFHLYLGRKLQREPRRIIDNVRVMAIPMFMMFKILMNSRRKKLVIVPLAAGVDFKMLPLSRYFGLYLNLWAT